MSKQRRLPHTESREHSLSGAQVKDTKGMVGEGRKCVGEAAEKRRMVVLGGPLCRTEGLQGQEAG